MASTPGSTASSSSEERMVSRVMRMMERNNSEAVAERKEERQMMMDLVCKLAGQPRQVEQAQPVEPETQQGSESGHITPFMYKLQTKNLAKAGAKISKLEEKLLASEAKVVELGDKLETSEVKVGRLEHMMKMPLVAKDGEPGHKVVELNNKLVASEIKVAELENKLKKSEEKRVQDKKNEEQKEVNQDLWFAAHAGQLEEVKAALAKGAQVNHIPRHPIYNFLSLRQMQTIIPPDTPLGVASKHPWMHVMQHLLEAGADPNLTHNSHRTVLCRVIENGNLEGVRLLLRYGANPNMGFPLMKACNQGQTSIARLLLEHGADINARTENGHTVFDCADNAWFNMKEIQELLQEYKGREIN